jgi:hypothetical protein
MIIDKVLEISGFSLSVGGMIAALWIGRKSTLMIVVSIVVALITLLLTGAVVAKGWYAHREAINEAQIEIARVVQTKSMTEEDIFLEVNAKRTPGHVWPDIVLFDALYCLMSDGLLHVRMQKWQDVYATEHQTHLYYR